jgi:cytosine permease
MSKLETLVEDFTTSPVPTAATVSGTRVALIIIGISIALPGFLMGAQIGTALGLVQSSIAFTAGGLILAVVASLTALVGAQARLSTYMLVQFAFGVAGARLVNAVFAVSLFGWFGVNAALFGDAMVATISELYQVSGGWPIYVTIGGVLMVLTTIFGFKALDRLSLLAVPLLVIILVAIMTLAIIQATPGSLLGTEPVGGGMNLGLAISAVAGGSMVGAATVPDLTRYISSRPAAVGSMFVAYGIGAPVILLSAAIPSLVTGEADLMKIFLGLGLGLPALFVLVFSTWTSNAANLYSSGLSLSATFQKIKAWKLTLIAGVLGTGVALSGIIDYFIPFLITLGVFMPPVAAVYVVDFYLVAHQRYNMAHLNRVPAFRWQAFLAWGLGSVLGLVTANDLVTVTAIPSCDSFLAAALVYFVLERVGNIRKAVVEGKGC